MPEKPALSDEEIVACLRDDYGLNVAQLTFLPLGADPNTAVYRLVADDQIPYFLKLRSGLFDETSVALPRFLSEQGIGQIIAPLRTSAGHLRAELGPFKVILYPFIEGRNGFEVKLSEAQWAEFGSTLKQLHTVPVPSELSEHIRRESYSPEWRERTQTILKRVEEGDIFDDPIAVEAAALVNAKRAQIRDLVARAERLAQALEAQSPPLVLCHSDIHAGNVLVAADGAFFIVDWDDPILAPKERDLMFIGGAQGFRGYTAEEEQRLFYQGYGQTLIDASALAYYRYKRIVVDIALFCEELLLSNEGGEDRAQSLRYLASNFLPNGTIETAYRSDRSTSSSTLAARP